MRVLAAFGPVSEETAILYIAAVVCFVVGAVRALSRDGVSAGVGFIGIGLALWLFPLMWNTVDEAFS
jgi:hypothetical protein